ncbi:hypothetical protein QTP86_025692, partial [Hemibagrus guttatus]
EGHLARNCPEEQETGTVTENIQEREPGENKQDSGEDNTQTEDQEENKQQGTTTESQEGRKDTETEVNHMESGNEQSQGDMTKDTEDSTQLANSQNTEECEGTDMTIDDSGFTAVSSSVNITRDITKSLKDLEIGIVELQALAESTGDRRHVEELKLKKAVMADLLGTKAQGALIRSRFKGANEMDAPSKYFFGLEKKNGQSRLIHTLHTGNGQYITHTDEIRRYATDFYQDLYRSEHRDNKELLDTFYQGLPKVSLEDNAALEGPLVLEELHAALNNMPGGKAPGIDGLPVEFYKFFCKELGEDLLEVLEESCRESCLPLSSWRAVITLLPKKGDLQDIKNWCPVSLLCTDYKVMSKELANRLRDIMDFVIQTDQTYCVPNRSIIDNVSLIRDILDISRHARLQREPSSGIQMDEGKITTIRNWPAPTTVKELQRFLGFANFYRRFIQNYSSIANSLTSLLRNKPKSLAWSPAAEEAFNTLKKAFTTATLLIHPDPNKPFIVEVDASTTGVGAVLSQQQGNPSRLRPCAFFSRKLNPAERNYDIGNRELLAVKLALEEWRHWLEGAKHSFLVLTDHENLEYLRAAKRLHP